MSDIAGGLRLRPSFGRVLRDKDFRLLWASGALDNTCRWMDTVVMGWLVLEITDSAWQVALLFVMRWVPMLGFAMFAGMVADQANRWLIMAAARCATVLVTVAILGLVIADAVQPWHLLLASLGLGWIYVLEFPSRRSFIYDMVGGRLIVSAMSLETISSTIGRLIGPLAAGLLIELSGFTGTYIFLVTGYLLALGSIALIKTRLARASTASRSIWQNVVDGIGYSLGNRVIRGVLAVTLIMNALAFSTESLFPVVARDHLHVGAGLAGVMISAPAIGSLSAATAIAWLGIVKYHGQVFCVGITLQLLGLLLFALSPWYSLSFVMLLLAGLGSAGFSTMQSTIILMSAAPSMRGTALGVLGQCIGVAALGGLLVGAMADYFNANVAVAISALMGLLLLIPVFALSPLARRPVPAGEEHST